jgi:uncharacterized membrane protein YebE (DUF533 family)
MPKAGVHMNIEDIIGTMIEGSLTSRRKRSYGATRFMRHGRGSFVNASTLLTVGGLIWGAIETMQKQSASNPGGAMPAPASTPPAARPATVPPPISAAPGPAAPPPPIPQAAPAAAEEAPGLPDGATRLIRLMVSASRADGQASEAEKQAILEHARKAGVEALVEDEWLKPTPLSSVVGVVTDPKQREDMYVLAYTIVRADEGICGAERIYLAQLASLLKLDRATVDRLEEETDSRITAAG